MEQKDKFIVSVLNSLGLGVNAMIPKNVDMCASRMRQTINGIKVQVIRFTDEILVLEINDGFMLEYEKNESRVISLKVLNKC